MGCLLAKRKNPLPSPRMQPFSSCSVSLPRPSFHHHYHQWDPRDCYQLVRTLQTAIFGSVHLAQDRRTGGHVVVKLSRKLGDDTSNNLAESPETETAIYAKLALEYHKEPGVEHVLRALDIRADENHHWLVLEYAEKGDLFDLCKDGGLDMNRAKALFVQAAQGLQYLHRRGICHRDISPENILVTADDVCKICDFGQAQIFGRENRGGKAGKKGYMAPEIVYNLDVDPVSADVFSLGVCLFVMLSGYPPFAEAHHTDQRYKVVRRGDLAKLVKNWNLTAKIPPSAIELLNGMLCTQDRRLRLEEVLAHPFLQPHDATTCTSIDIS